MTDHLRRIALYIDEPDPGVFHWVLIESTDEAHVWSDVDASETSYKSWIAAMDAGTVALMRVVKDERIGPRTVDGAHTI